MALEGVSLSSDWQLCSICIHKERKNHTSLLPSKCIYFSEYKNE